MQTAFLKVMSVFQIISCTKYLIETGRRSKPNRTEKQTLVIPAQVISAPLGCKIGTTNCSDLHIFSDSQSAIGILKLGWQPTLHKHTVAEIKQEIQRLEQKHITVNISWTPGHANIEDNEEADRLAKEASFEAATMKSDTDVVTMADIKQAAIKMGLSQLQRQWESTESGRSLFKYKPYVTDKSQIDFPTTISYRNIAKLRLGYNKLRDYQFKLGVSDSNLCECGQTETVEHYLLHCEKYLNEREALRTRIFNTTGTVDFSCEIDLRKTHGLNICSVLGDFITLKTRF